MQLSRSLTKRMATKFAATATRDHIRWMSRQQEEQKQGQWAIFSCKAGIKLGDFSLDIYCCAVAYHIPGEGKDLIGSVESLIFNLLEFMALLFPAVLNFRLMLYCM
jgi:hypothetical protein